MLSGEVPQHDLRIPPASIVCGLFEGVRPLPPTSADSRNLGFFDFSENAEFCNFPVGSGVWEGVQSIDASCGIQIDGFSARTEPPGSIFDYFDALTVLACDFNSLTLHLAGPKTTSESPKSA